MFFLATALYLRLNDAQVRVSLWCASCNEAEMGKCGYGLGHGLTIAEHSMHSTDGCRSAHGCYQHGSLRSFVHICILRHDNSRWCSGCVAMIEIGHLPEAPKGAA